MFPIVTYQQVIAIFVQGMVMNETKWYKIWTKTKVLVKTNCFNLPPTFVKGMNKHATFSVLLDTHHNSNMQNDTVWWAYL